MGATGKARIEQRNIHDNKGCIALAAKLFRTGDCVVFRCVIIWAWCTLRRLQVMKNNLVVWVCRAYYPGMLFLFQKQLSLV